MNKILGFNDKTDLTLSKDSTNVVVFKRDKRLAWILSIFPIFFWYHFYYTGNGLNWTKEGDVVFFLGCTAVILIILIIIAMRHQLIFNIPKKTYYENVGFFPFAMKKRSGSLGNISIELVKEKRGMGLIVPWWQYPVYVVNIVFPSQRRVGLRLFHDLAKAEEYLNYLSKKLQIKGKKDLDLVPEKG